jgi:exonuclease SbcC
MRPIKLTLQAFGPFADTQTVDFREALETRLFGIYGPTGAGKTSILDGLCFALFGESSGQERQGEDLRSHHATVAVETEAHLIFEVGVKRYFLVRRPRQIVRGKRGDALVERQHWAALYDATGLEIDDINSDNPGVVMEERKVEVVAERMRSILNYSAAQFRQVVLLPQGQFRQLLTASSDQRSAVLRGLFDVLLYERLVEHLKADASDLRDRVEQGRAQIQGYLQSHNAPDAEALETMIAAAAAEVIVQTGARDVAITARDTLRIALQTTQGVAARFVEYDAAVAALDLVEKQQERIDALKARQSAAHQAQGCAASDQRVEEAAKELAAGVEALALAQAEADQQETAAELAAEALAVSLAHQDRRDAAAALLTGLQAFHDRVTRAEPLRAASRQSGATARLARQQLDHAGPAHSGAEGALERANNRCVQMQQRMLRVAEVETTTHTLRQEHERSATYLRTKETVDRLADLRRQEQANLEVLREALAWARAGERSAEQALSSAQAIHLAHTLIDGEPCPVCGSQDHPQPAVGDTQGQGLDRAWRDARVAWDIADAAERTGSETAARADGEWVQAVARLQELATPERDLPTIKGELARAELELETLRADCDIRAAQAEVDLARAALSVTVAALTAARDAHMAADKTAASEASALEGALSDVPADLRDTAAIAARLKAGTLERDRQVAEHHVAIANERTASDAVKGARATLAHAQTRERELATARDTHRAAFQAAKRSVGLDDATYILAKADIANLGALTTQIGAHAEAQASAVDRRDRAALAINDLVRPNLAEAETALAASDAALTMAEQTLTSTSLKLKQFKATLLTIQRLDAELAEATERFRVLGELAQLTDGRNAHRLRLRDFAIAATFDLVLEAANLRFARMSRGRFALLRKFEGGDGRARAGLDIEVYDAHTDQKRDAHTLSGGEGFLASLSLALGLSDVVQAEAGGVKLDAIFIDEGFGHLDDETLDVALDTLRDLVGQDRAVGVISHVDSVKQQIPAGFDVVRTLRGSTIEPRRTA